MSKFLIFLGALESLHVEFDGETYPLQELAQVGRKNPQLAVLNLASLPDAINPEIVKFPMDYNTIKKNIILIFSGWPENTEKCLPKTRRLFSWSRKLQCKQFRTNTWSSAKTTKICRKIWCLVCSNRYASRTNCAIIIWYINLILGIKF